MRTFKIDAIPSESSVFNGAIFGPAIFLVILCTSINKDWNYKDKDKGAIVGPPIFLRLNYKDWKYKSCPLVLFSTSTLSQIFTKPFKIIQIKKNRTVFLDSQIISSVKVQFISPLTIQKEIKKFYDNVFVAFYWLLVGLLKIFCNICQSNVNCQRNNFNQRFSKCSVSKYLFISTKPMIANVMAKSFVWDHHPLAAFVYFYFCIINIHL